MFRKIYIILMIVAIGLAGCSDEIETPTSLPELPDKPATPRGLTASVADGQIQIEWTVNDPGAVDRYVVYVSDSGITEMPAYDTVTQRSVTIDDLVNGRRYYFRVSSIYDGLEGFQSTPISATPGIFSMLLADGKEYTRARSIKVELTAPEGAYLVQISEDSTFDGTHWQTFAIAKNFELSDGDGLKTVYTRFELDGGGNSAYIISDDIRLDRVAMIDDFMVSYGSGLVLEPGDILAGGEKLRFQLYVSESGGEASVEIAGLGQIDLNDLGVGGDDVPDDNIFGGEYTISDETEVEDALITAYFTDVAGNEAPEYRHDVRLNVTSAPAPVTIWGFALTSLQIQLTWSESDAADFSRYRLFRALCDSDTTSYFDDSVLVSQVLNAGETRLLDDALLADTIYAYWVYTTDIYGNSSVSDTAYIRTMENYPPDTLKIMAKTTGDSLTVRVSWEEKSQAEDFKLYYFLRDSDSTIMRAYMDAFQDTLVSLYPSDLVIDFIDDRQTTTYTDSDVPATGTYYYQVYVVDRQGLVSRSNIEEIDVAF